MPMHRAMHPPTARAPMRVISCLASRSSGLWWMWQKRLIFSPVRWEVVVKMPSCSGMPASVKVAERMSWPGTFSRLRISPPR